MSALQHSEEHRVAALVRQVHEDLTSVAGTPLWSMTAAEAADALVLLTQARSQLDSLLMQVLRHGETVGTGLDSGAATALLLEPLAWSAIAATSRGWLCPRVLTAMPARQSR